jgi:hypothetical protein
MRITIEDDKDKWIHEGEIEHILDLFKAFKQLSLAIGHHSENVDRYFGDCENWSE